MNADWFENVPKIELHLHLEGAVPLDALWQLMQKYGGDPLVIDRAALEKKFEYTDFPHFIETWVWKNQFLREYDDFTLIAETLARDLARQNVRYAEVFYSPSDFGRHKLEVQGLTQAIRTGFERVPNIELALIVDLVRGRSQENVARTFAAVNEVKDLGVIGIGIGGLEEGFPPEPFAEVYEQARNLGFHTTAHAGEGAGAASIWGAVRNLKVERIGHGVRATEDPALVDYLAEHQIALEVCPISNVRTGVVPDIEQHPVRYFYERGLLVTINTDDPQMFNTSLAQEYRTLHDKLGFTQDDLRQLILNGITACWLPEPRKAALRQSFVSDPHW